MVELKTAWRSVDNDDVVIVTGYDRIRQDSVIVPAYRCESATNRTTYVIAREEFERCFRQLGMEPINERTNPARKTDT